jgi:hypothetical protein
VSWPENATESGLVPETKVVRQDLNEKKRNMAMLNLTLRKMLREKNNGMV